MDWLHRGKPKPKPDPVYVYVFGVAPQAEVARFVPGGFWMSFMAFGIRNNGTAVNLHNVRVFYQYADTPTTIRPKITTAVLAETTAMGIEPANVTVVIHGI